MEESNNRTMTIKPSYLVIHMDRYIYICIIDYHTNLYPMSIEHFNIYIYTHTYIYTNP